MTAEFMLTDAELIALGKHTKARYAGQMQVKAEDPTRHYPCCDHGCRPLTNLEMLGLLARAKHRREITAAEDLEAISAAWAIINH